MFCSDFDGRSYEDVARGERGTGDAGGRRATDPAVNARGRIASLVAVALVIGGLFWALQAVVRHNALQNCIDSGRRDCGDPPAP